MNALVNNEWVHLAVAVCGLALATFFHVCASLETWWLARGLWDLRRPRGERADAPLGMTLLLAVRVPFFWAMIGGLWWSVLRG